MSRKKHFYHRFTGTDIVVPDAMRGVVEALKWNCASTQGANPTPDAPQTIYSTGDPGVLNVWTHKKNMLKSSDFDTFNTNGGNSYDVTNKIITLTQPTPTSNAGRYKFFKLNVGKRYYFSVYVRTNRVFNIKVGLEGGASTIPSSTEYTRIISTLVVTNTNTPIVMYHISGGNTGDWIQFKDWQLEEGQSLTDYEPYSGSDTPITLPPNYPGGSLPNGVADTEALQKVGKVVLNGSESWNGVASLTSDAACVSFYKMGYKGVSNSTINTLCDKFISTTRTLAGSISGENCGINSTGSLWVTILKSRIVGWSDSWTELQKINAFKTWLASNNVTVYYELATPVAITPTIDKAPMYEGETTITTTNNVKAVLTADVWAR